LAAVIWSPGPEWWSGSREDFLRYVVEQTLAGRGEQVKEYSIATDVFGRQALLRIGGNPGGGQQASVSFLDPRPHRRQRRMPAPHSLTTTGPKSEGSANDLFRVHVSVHDDTEEREHHLFPSHRAIVHGLIRIGIEIIVGRVIVVCLYM